MDFWSIFWRFLVISRNFSRKVSSDRVIESLRARSCLRLARNQHAHPESSPKSKELSKTE